MENSSIPFGHYIKLFWILKHTSVFEMTLKLSAPVVAH